MLVALRLVFILFPDCNIAAPVSFSYGEEPLSYTHHNPWRTYIRRNPSYAPFLLDSLKNTVIPITHHTHRFFWLSMPLNHPGSLK